MVEVLGGSVNVRAGDNTETAILGVAHKGDSFLLEGVSASAGTRSTMTGRMDISAIGAT